MARRFTKYPSNYVKASTDTNRYMKDLSEYLDYLSDDEIAAIQIDHIDDGYEPECWLEIPEHLRSTVEDAIGIDLCSPNESYWYQIEYHPDDDSIAFGINTDINLEKLEVSQETEDRFKQKFREAIGVTASTSIKADTDPTFEDTIHQFIEKLKSDRLVKKNIYPYTWTSGSSTTVYPITVSQGAIELQWASDREPKAFLDKWEQIGKDMGILDYAYFWKSDGSCPSYITFKLNSNRY